MLRSIHSRGEKIALLYPAALRSNRGIVRRKLVPHRTVISSMCVAQNVRAIEAAERYFIPVH